MNPKATDHSWQVIQDFAHLLALPNVTGDHAALRINAEEISQRFTERGAEMRIVELENAAPVVIGKLDCPNPTATIGVYVHYDGQPVDPNNWTTPPFEPTLTTGPWHGGGEVIDLPKADDPIDPEWRLYARSASDDKAPLAAITAALDRLSVTNQDRTVNLVFLFEGEEESGSPNLARYMEELHDELQADAWLLCDGPVDQSRAPQVAFGARGYSGFDLTFFGPERELHSGHYGNWVPNPALELSQFLASCKDSDGHVTIPGFYDSMVPITHADRDAVTSVPDTEATLRDELGFAAPEVDNSSLLERLLMPSFNIRGMSSAGTGSTGRNVIPAQATASIDMRLAAGDDPHHMITLVRSHLEDSGYTVLDRPPDAAERRQYRRLALLEPMDGYRAARIPMDTPLAESLLDICRRASGEEPVALPTFGGSVPLYLFEDLLGAPVAILPMANHDNNQHGPDENIRLANLFYGVSLCAALLTTDMSGVESVQ